MIQDAAIPAGLEPPTSIAEQHGVCYTAARWTPQALENLARRLRFAGRKELAAVSNADLLAAWSATVTTFLDPSSRERQALDPSLARLCQLSPAGLEAGLEAVLGGVGPGPARELQIEASKHPEDEAETSLALVILASNLPALAVQPLLPALLLRYPVILKSPSAEPLFAPAFVRSLIRRLPALETSLAAVSWQGGDASLEAPLLEQASRVLAYGDNDSLSDLRQRAGQKLFAYGPKTSLAILSETRDTTRVAAGLARDIALFDQRGCLSIQAIFTSGEPVALATAIAEELAELARLWPPGGIDPLAAAGVQQLRSEAVMRGLTVAETPLQIGTVIVEPQPRFAPTPGLRTVRVHPLKPLDRLPELLSEWSGSLQGAALHGDEAWRLRPALAELGISHFAAPGELQRPDASWHNGGVPPLEVLTGH